MNTQTIQNEHANTIGKCGCAFCGEDLPVRNNGRGTLNVTCPWCGVSAYAKPNTQAHKIIMSWLPKEASAVVEKSQETPPSGKRSFFTKEAA